MFNVVFIFVCCHRVKNNTCGEYMEAVGNDEHVISFIQFSSFVIENIYFFYRACIKWVEFWWTLQDMNRVGFTSIYITRNTCTWTGVKGLNWRKRRKSCCFVLFTNILVNTRFLFNLRKWTLKDGVSIQCRCIACMSYDCKNNFYFHMVSYLGFKINSVHNKKQYLHAIQKIKFAS